MTVRALAAMVSVLAFSALFGLVAGKPAHAEGWPPRYDTDGLCFRNANSTDGFSPEAVTSCLASQSNALNRLRRIWDVIPTGLEDDCDERTRITGRQDYIALENCIKEQMSQNTTVPLVPPREAPVHPKDDDEAPQ
ncbi:hypothetical protein [Acetobacter papayae]|uniref:hypothetical protein n=1 Tax=Acetobacter papayae TaxID=1076592 RepID=UPI00046F40C3|nr:hypothetical protein [Acetobacter papayae]